MKRKRKRNYFHELPYDIILYIFSFVPKLRSYKFIKLKK